MNPGLFNKRITFQKIISEINENGFPSENWEEVKSAWAMIKTMNDKGSSYEFYAASSTQSKNTSSFVIRYTSGLSTDMRILFGSRTFEILSIINDNEANKTLTIVGREVV